MAPPQAVPISDLQEREKAGTYSGFEIPTEKTMRKTALVTPIDGASRKLGSRPGNGAPLRARATSLSLP